jgi:hypothetical protein
VAALCLKLPSTNIALKQAATKSDLCQSTDYLLNVAPSSLNEMAADLNRLVRFLSKGVKSVKTFGRHATITQQFAEAKA